MSRFHFYELMQEAWFMHPMYLHQMRMNLLSASESATKEEPKPTALSIYDERQNRVNHYRNEIPENSTAVVNIIGAMTKYGSWLYWGADEIIEQLDFANQHKNISAIVINVDGPGGAVSAISPFIDFAARKQKPVVAVCDMACSLHYWIANAISDHIMAGNTISAKFGSVGVVSSWMDLMKYYEKLGVKYYEVYPEESAHKNEIMRAIEADEKKGIELLRNKELSPLAQKFQEAIKTARPNLKADAEGVLSGRVFGAEEALELGMIDSIGNLSDAMNVSQILSETKYVKI